MPADTSNSTPTSRNKGHHGPESHRTFLRSVLPYGCGSRPQASRCTCRPSRPQVAQRTSGWQDYPAISHSLIRNLRHRPRGLNTVMRLGSAPGAGPQATAWKAYKTGGLLILSYLCILALFHFPRSYSRELHHYNLREAVDAAWGPPPPPRPAGHPQSRRVRCVWAVQRGGRTEDAKNKGGGSTLPATSALESCVAVFYG